MAATRAEVVRVVGTCHADLEEGDVFLVGGLRVESQGNDKAGSSAPLGPETSNEVRSATGSARSGGET